MDIQFVAQIDASADVVAFPVRKGEAGALGALLGALAKQARFDGAAGSVAETAAFDGDRATRLLLVGIGEGTVHDLERAGGALTRSGGSERPDHQAPCLPPARASQEL